MKDTTRKICYWIGQLNVMAFLSYLYTVGKWLLSDTKAELDLATITFWFMLAFCALPIAMALIAMYRGTNTRVSLVGIALLNLLAASIVLIGFLFTSEQAFPYQPGLIEYITVFTYLVNAITLPFITGSRN